MLNNKKYNNPVFICGYPKSGTTLISSLLDSHNDLLVIPEETGFFRNILAKNAEEQFDSLFYRTGLGLIQQGIVDEPSGERDYTNLDFDLMYSCAKQYWQSSSKHEKYLLQSVVHGIDSVSDTGNFRFWVEKTPRNEFYLRTIKKYWPNAKCIYIARDPRQVFCSYREYQNKRAKPTNININNFIETWSDSVKSFQRYLYCGGDGLVVRYEDLVQNNETTMERVVKYLGIPFEKSLLNPTRNGSSWTGNSSQNKKYLGIKKAVVTYPDKLSCFEIMLIEKSLKRQMKIFDYTPSVRFVHLKYWVRRIYEIIL